MRVNLSDVAATCAVGSLLRSFVDPALVGSEDLRVYKRGERGGVVAFNAETWRSHFIDLSIGF
jgi:hypothetical protein